MLILSLLTGGIGLALRAQIEQRQLVDTRLALDEAREALLSFAAANGRLPCPAESPSDGRESALAPSGCARSRGLLPWEALGIRALDGWNHRLAYQLTPGFGLPGLASGTKTGLDAEGSVQIQDGAGKALASTGAVAAAIWSLGANGHFAVSADGVPQHSDGAGSDETRNSPSAPAAMLIAKSEIARPGEEFDDQVIWISRYLLIGRMMSSGRLP